MRTPIYQVDAFATQLFSGNPAAVMPLKAFPSDAVMQAIAAENNLAETAFLVRELGKTAFRAFQASRRGGEITCRLAGDRVELEGNCVFYLEGQVEI
jgi:predicted PhzF superfamily epimerase YddE/YHI9